MNESKDTNLEVNLMSIERDKQTEATLGEKQVGKHYDGTTISHDDVSRFLSERPDVLEIVLNEMKVSAYIRSQRA